MRRLLYALPLLASVACSPARGDAYRVFISTSFTVTQTEAVTAALYDWSGSVPVRFTLAMGDCPGVTDGVVCVRPGSGDGTWAVTYGNEEHDGGDIRLDVGALGGLLQGAAAHEIGHAMGLEHETGSADPVLMFPSSTAGRWSPIVTANDSQQWYRVRGRVAEVN
jgi:hypothetical protein